VIADRTVQNLVGQYLVRVSERGGWYWEFRQGISRGCPLTPLMGAFFLKELDERMEALGLFYVRFMDDILVLAPTRWKLRGVVREVNRGLDCLGLEKHPEKTFIGRVERGSISWATTSRPRG
jgi:RNA-directed DNA polymerase